MVAFERGRMAKSILDNPYWLEYPKPSSKGQQDETDARLFVDGWLARYLQEHTC